MKRLPRSQPRKVRGVCVALVTVLALFSAPAHAYLDPSTGSMIVTAIVGLVASIGLAIRTYWYRLKSFFKGDRERKSGDDESVQSRQDGDTTENPSA